MILIFHIFIAVVSVLYATYALLLPTRVKINVSLVMAITTLLSGTYLIVSTNASLINACISGIIYTSTVVLLIVLANKRLVAQKIKIKD
ncbi:MAG: hypothetical protein U0451_00720 [Candidatus Saccharimonadales bacterium]